VFGVVSTPLLAGGGKIMNLEIVDNQVKCSKCGCFSCQHLQYLDYAVKGEIGEVVTVSKFMGDRGPETEFSGILRKVHRGSAHTKAISIVEITDEEFQRIAR
jgi:hypothetical protein